MELALQFGNALLSAKHQGTLDAKAAIETGRFRKLEVRFVHCTRGKMNETGLFAILVQSAAEHLLIPPGWYCCESSSRPNLSVFL